MSVADLPRHKGQRNKLIKVLIEKGIRDQAVLKAINKIPRHAFVDSSFEDFAYQDKAFAISEVTKAGVVVTYPDKAPFIEAVQPIHAKFKDTKIGQYLNQIGAMAGEK